MSRHTQIVERSAAEVTKKFGGPPSRSALQERPSPHRVIAGKGVTANADEKPELASVANIDVDAMRRARSSHHATLKQTFTVGPYLELSRPLTLLIIIDPDIRRES